MSTDNSNDVELNMPSLALNNLIAQAAEITLPATIERYDQAIKNTETLISDLASTVRKAEQFRGRQARARNALLPIHTLPPELLIRIWTSVTQEFAKSRKDGVWILSQVSALWADLVSAASELWCTITSAFPLKRTQLALTKSAGRPLSIILGMEEDVTETFNILLPESHRWRELWLAFGLPEASQTLKVISLPLLELLHVSPHYKIGDPADLEPLNLVTCPCLNSLIVDSIPLDWSTRLPVPDSLRYLAIENVKQGPTLSQMLSLLSSTTRLEVLLLDRVGLPPGGHNWGSADEQKPVTMPHLRKLGLLRTDSIFIQKLVSCIQAGNCTLIALQYTTLSSINFLRSRVASIASSAEKIFLHIDDHEDQGLISISTFDHLNKIRPFSVSEATSDVTGFSVVFLTGPNSVNLEQAMPFIAYTPIPISMTLHSSPKASQAALARLDWDRLPSLCELRTEPYINIPPILYRLSGPRGPRHAPRWPCPKLTILRLLRLKFLPPAFVWHLHLRWGPPESDDGLKRDPSRPAQLTLCQAPLQGISKLLSPDAMKHFAEEWEDSVPVEEVGETLKDHSRRSSDDLDDLEEASETSET